MTTNRKGVCQVRDLTPPLSYHISFFLLPHNVFTSLFFIILLFAVNAPYPCPWFIFSAMLAVRFMAGVPAFFTFP